MSPWLDRLSLAVLVLALGLLGWDQTRGAPTARHAAVPLLLPSDPPGSLHAPGADERALRARAASVGEVLTIEDLIRLAVLLEEGRGAEVGVELPPLTEAERSELRARIQAADEHRRALLAAEGDLAAADRALRDAATRLAADLSPDQRAWIQANRDAVSVGEVEEAYWQRALGAAP